MHLHSSDSDDTEWFEAEKCRKNRSVGLQYGKASKGSERESAASGEGAFDGYFTQRG